MSYPTPISAIRAELAAAAEGQGRGPMSDLLRRAERLIGHLAEQLRPKTDGRGMVSFDVTSGVGAATRAPFVGVQYGGQLTQMSPEAARGLAMNLLGAAEAAETDAQLLTFLRQQDFTEAEAAGLLTAFRFARERRRGKEAESA